MTGILEQLKWKSLKKRRKDNRLISRDLSGQYVKNKSVEDQNGGPLIGG